MPGQAAKGVRSGGKNKALLPPVALRYSEYNEIIFKNCVLEVEKCVPPEGKLRGG